MHYVVGDIHSNYTELKKLISHISPKQTDTMIFLGDLLNKGDQPKETIDFLDHIQSKTIYLFGNHDYVWKQYLLEGNMDRKTFLLEKGGTKTVPIETLSIPDLKVLLKDYLQIIKRMKSHLIIDNYFLVHGGISKDQLHNKDLKIGEKNFFLRPKDIDMDTKYLGKYRVISGHTHISTDPQFHSGYVNIDTGSGEGKYISAYVIEEKKVIRSDGRVFYDKY